jgi:drug/metabolite transporter (DMT)-like permease
MTRHAHVPLVAIALICASTACFALLDAVMKALSAHYPVLLLVWVRWIIQAVALALWLAPREGLGFLRTAHPWKHVVRGAILIASSVTFMTALKSLPLAEATALNYSSPVIVTILAALVLGERMTGPRVLFVLAGIFGMVLIVRPGTAMFQSAALLSVASAVFYATFQVMTRRMAGEDPGALLFYPALVGAIALAVAVPFAVDGPLSMAWPDVALLVGGGLMGTFGHFLFILAFKRADASALTPFTYFQLVWATLIGWLVFANFPDLPAFVGMAVIACSGLAIALHERWRARRDRRAAPADLESSSRPRATRSSPSLHPGNEPP